MKVELLVAPDCPAWKETERLLKGVLGEQSVDVSFHTTVVASPEQAMAEKFPGSPTVRINGQDIEPEGDKAFSYTLA